MKINSLNLQAFFVAARIGHFTQAAEELNITQSALSQRVAKLEQELEAVLFIREKKTLRLTDTGHQLLRYCQVHDAIESDLLEKLKTSSQGYAGSINVGCFSSVGRSLVIPAIKPLLVEHPKLSLNLINREVKNLGLLMSSSSVSYIITTEDTEDNNIESIPLGFEDNVLVKSKKVGLSEVYLDHDRNDLTTQSYFLKNKLKFKPDNFHYLDDVYGLIDGVKQGLGLAVLPLHLISQESSLEVVNSSKNLRVPVYLQFYKQPFYRTLHSEVIEHLVAHISMKLS